MAASKTGTSAPSASTNREILATRIFDGPRELVFKLWTDPKHIVNWWGPRGFTTTIHEMDVKPGGVWRFVMHGPDGVDYQNRNVYVEVVEPERLVFDHMSGPRFRMSVAFTGRGNKTEVSVQMLFESAQEREQTVKKFGAVEGLQQTLDRLSEEVAQAAAGEVVITRIFDARRELVFQAWTESERLARWWGPREFTNPVCEVDVRPGGAIRIHMRAPDGTVHPMGGSFREVVPPERLVFTSTPLDDKGGAIFEVLHTVTFADLGAQTRMTMCARPVMTTPAAAPMLAWMEQGLNQSFDKLAEEVAGAPQEFSFTRVFDASREMVWKAFTESERLMQWWGPKGFTMLTCKVDLRPGGVFHYSMRMPNGREMWGKWIYREIAAPERLVTVVSFSDEQGREVRHPMNPTWPLELLHTMTLTEQDGKTTLTVKGVPINATEEERKTFEAGRDGMRQGFTGTLDQLAEYLAKA